MSVCQDGGVTELWVCQLGVVEYREAYALQERVCDARQAQRIPDTLLLLEHHPVYTRGRRAEPGELPMGTDWYLMQGIDVVETDRGGKVTYHGPGQLVGYPIMGVQDVVAFVRTMESAIVAALAEEEITARARPDEGRDFTGVWVDERKIASIGVHVARGVTTHGFADNDLQPFEWVVPCGLEDVRMTSVTREKRTGDHMPSFRERMARHFAQAHGLEPVEIEPDRLDAATAVPSEARLPAVARPHAT
jgi:lipoyl(octanoyl) transferase